MSSLRAKSRDHGHGKTPEKGNPVRVERPGSKRLFLGVRLSQALSDTVETGILELQELAEAEKLRVNWVQEKNLHVTLRFLGSTPVDQISQVCDSVERVAAGLSMFPVRVRGAGAFPDEKWPRSLWFGIEDPAGLLAKAVSQFEEMMRTLGFAHEDRAFTPHLTVGKIRTRRGCEKLLEPLRTRDFGETRVTEILLFETVTNPGGSEYEVVRAFPLKSQD